jgi:hypothetical protein
MSPARTRIKYWADGSIEFTQTDPETETYRMLTRTPNGALHSLVINGDSFSESQLQSNHFLNTSSDDAGSIVSTGPVRLNRGLGDAAADGDGVTVTSINRVNPNNGNQQTGSIISGSNFTTENITEVNAETGSFTSISGTSVSHIDDTGDIVTTGESHTYDSATGASVDKVGNSVRGPDGSYSSTTVTTDNTTGDINISTTSIDGQGNGTTRVMVVDKDGNLKSDTSYPVGPNADNGGGSSDPGGLNTGPDTPEPTDNPGNSSPTDTNPAAGGDGAPGGPPPEASGDVGVDQEGGGSESPDTRGGLKDSSNGITSSVGTVLNELGIPSGDPDLNPKAMNALVSGLRSNVQSVAAGDGWEDGTDGPTRPPLVDDSGAHIAKGAVDDWGNLNNPRAMVAAFRELMTGSLMVRTVLSIESARKAQAAQ